MRVLLTAKLASLRTFFAYCIERDTLLRSIKTALGDTYADYLPRTAFSGYVWAGTGQTAARPRADNGSDSHLIVHNIIYDF